MANPRNQSFVLAAGNSGPLILSRHDFNVNCKGEFYGVGAQLLNYGSYDPNEINAICKVLSLLHHARGHKLTVIDGGANIGVHTIEMAKHMTGWGKIIAIEPQRYLYYALCGNIVLNNCFNVVALRQVLAECSDETLVPNLDFQRPGSFGSLELERHAHNENIGQQVNEYSLVDQISIDEICPDAFVDFIKLDIEGMEFRALQGADGVIKRCSPVIFVEIMKSDVKEICDWFHARNYIVTRGDINAIAVHEFRSQ